MSAILGHRAGPLRFLEQLWAVFLGVHPEPRHSWVSAAFSRGDAVGLRSAAWQGANPEKDSVCTRADWGRGAQRSIRITGP